MFGSLAIHALLAVLLLSIHRSHDEAGEPPRVELVDVAIAHDTAPQTPAVPAASSPHRSARRGAEQHLAVPRTATLGELRVEPVGDSAGAGGGGDGDGFGLGTGRGLADLLPATPSVPAPPPAPPPPRSSKARPARLVYPSRQTQVDEDQLFIAEVIVDTDGFVVGARLAHGTNGPRDTEAGAAVWRFRYEPALDDDGAPVRSTVHQQFAVAW